ncbi:class I SAM-dependent methyltransferase [Dyella silvae]|uniref:class I SAM-dependent methyltransferase n=1 Tax=Dyella silvae TaxID=2994424 RepID=UPI002263DD19|nr:class I SAM-dependent methyltransferase [Dyella silvae]
MPELVENNLFSLMKEFLAYADGMPLLGDVPDEIAAHLPQAHELVEKVADEIGAGTHGPYFEVSKNRYAHYFAAGMAVLTPGAKILDIGNAPGHVGIGFTLMGHRVQGLNLNSNWRSTYPSEAWFNRFQIVESDIEAASLPFEDESFDAILFTEVLEHIGIKHPLDIVRDMRRVLKPGGVLIFSTPNVCNVSNLYALLKGQNIFWAPEIFYGSLDRHNREYAPQEVDQLMVNAGFDRLASWGLNDYSNWRAGGAAFASEFVSTFGADNPLCRNTIAGVYKRGD